MLFNLLNDFCKFQNDKIMDAKKMHLLNENLAFRMTVSRSIMIILTEKIIVGINIQMLGFQFCMLVHYHLHWVRLEVISYFVSYSPGQQ